MARAAGSKQQKQQSQSGPQPCGYCKNPGVEPFFGSLLPGGNERNEEWRSMQV